MKRSTSYLAGVVLLLLMMVLIGNQNIVYKSKPFENEKIQASLKLEQIFKQIRMYKNHQTKDWTDYNTPLKAHDLTGLEYSEITTTLGNERAKRTSINPNFAAVIMDMLIECGLSEGDVVALNLSGSFPALNFAAIVAVEELGYTPVIMSSIGSSTYGANDPSLTYQDMEWRIYNEGLINTRSSLVSAGGDGDLGKNMDPESLDQIINRLQNRQYKIYSEPDLEVNINKRLKDLKHAKILINVGGNLVSQNTSDLGYFWEFGLIEPSQKLNYKNDGLIGGFLSRGKPVIQMLNILDIAAEYNMPIDPDLVPLVGTGGVYKGAYVSSTIVVMGLIIFVMVVGIYGGIQRKQTNEQLFGNIKHRYGPRGGAVYNCTGYANAGERSES